MCPSQNVMYFSSKKPFIHQARCSGLWVQSTTTVLQYLGSIPQGFRSHSSPRDIRKSQWWSSCASAQNRLRPLLNNFPVSEGFHVRSLCLSGSRCMPQVFRLSGFLRVFQHFLMPAADVVDDCHGIRDLCLRLGRVGHVNLVLDVKKPKSCCRTFFSLRDFSSTCGSASSVRMQYLHL